MSSVLEDLRFSQDELETLCQEPALPNPELTGMNGAFGMGSVFRRYAGLPQDEPLTFACDHGVPLDPKFFFPLDFEHGLPGYLAAYEERAAFLREQGKPRVLISAFPLHYARRLLEKSGTWTPPAERRGTLLFPYKSSNLTDVQFDAEALADWAAALPQEYQPVCVCVYWIDYLKGRHVAYMERGLPVVTCGHNASPDFLLRLIDLCTHFKYSCSNSVEGSYSLSVACGCWFIYKGIGEVDRNNPTDGAPARVTNPGAHTKYGAQLLPLAPFPPRPEFLDKQRGLAAHLTGENRILLPEEFRELQDWGRNWLLERQPAEVSFIENMAPADLNQWVPINVRKDGWAGPAFRILIKPHPARRSLSLYFKLSQKICDGPQCLKVSAGDGRPGEFVCEPGRYRLSLALPKSETAVWVRLPREIEAIEKARGSKALRILGWGVDSDHAGEPKCESVSRKRLPFYAAVPEGW